MATMYKTPGVYVEEIPKFPPSIAPVETAIPAFIGYTEKADNITPGDLLNKPRRIGSLREYEYYFGYGPKPDITEIKLDDDNNFLSASFNNTFYLYDSLQMFYANGGGDCYIVSVGTYSGVGATKSDTHFTDSGAGLDAVKLFDEPTILLFPDAVLLGTMQLYNVQKAALMQAEALMDRVAVLDLKKGDPKGDEFRSNIGVNSLKYGMAYTPWLNVNMPKNVSYRDIRSDIKRGGTTVSLRDLTTETAIQNAIDLLDDVVNDADLITAKVNTLLAGSPSFRARFNSLVASYQSTKNPTTFKAINAYLFSFALEINVLAGASGLTDADLKNSLISAIGSDFKTIFSDLIALERDAEEDPVKIAGYDAVYNDAPYSGATWVTAWGNIFTSSKPAALTIIPAIASGVTITDQMDSVLDEISEGFDKLNAAFLSILVNGSKRREKDLDSGLREQFPLYKSILTGIDNTESDLPPSGAVAGIYALVDRTRGVWKAPANVSLNRVIAPSHVFTATELDALNVDTGGKSINAIRAFTGKGTLIYGARTLAGNDNEWRYVSVRRFFNFVEESVKKATEQFVFEPNDANTWVRVQAMIENFLTTLWRQGALQGVKPEHAFYVAVGLGKTMTPLDILEGRMIIEIGMAAVRPAEFIILRFSHKMAES